MAIVRILFVGAALVGAAPLALAQATTNNTATVYKCKNTDGSVVYSRDPCSSDPKKMETIDTSGALRTGSGGHQGEIAASVADSDCRDNAYKTTHAADNSRIVESNQHIADYRTRREELQSQANYYGGGADPEMHKAIDDLDASIAHESEFQQKDQAISEQNYQSALKACDAALKK